MAVNDTPSNIGISFQYKIAYLVLSPGQQGLGASVQDITEVLNFALLTGCPVSVRHGYFEVHGLSCEILPHTEEYDMHVSEKDITCLLHGCPIITGERRGEFEMPASAAGIIIYTALQHARCREYILTDVERAVRGSNSLHLWKKLGTQVNLDLMQEIRKSLQEAKIEIKTNLEVVAEIKTGIKKAVKGLLETKGFVRSKRIESIRKDLNKLLDN